MGRDGVRLEDEAGCVEGELRGGAGGTVAQLRAQLVAFCVAEEVPLPVDFCLATLVDAAAVGAIASGTVFERRDGFACPLAPDDRVTRHSAQPTLVVLPSLCDRLKPSATRHTRLLLEHWLWAERAHHLAPETQEAFSKAGLDGWMDLCAENQRRVVEEYLGCRATGPLVRAWLEAFRGAHHHL